jgi:hypothetical protein
MTIFDRLDEIGFKHPPLDGEIGGEFNDQIFIVIGELLILRVNTVTADNFELEKGMDFMKENDIDVKRRENPRKLKIEISVCVVYGLRRASDQQTHVQVRRFLSLVRRTLQVPSSDVLIRSEKIGEENTVLFEYCLKLIFSPFHCRIP